jgi:NAD(P)H-dependent FMN reductase
MKNQFRMTSRVRWALLACALALASGTGAATLSAEDDTGQVLKAIGIAGVNGQTVAYKCETQCPKDAQCCRYRTNHVGDEEVSNEGTISN